MRNSHLLSALGFSLILGTPGCGGFIPLGSDDAGVGGSGMGAGSNVGAGGSSVNVLDAGPPGCIYNGVTYWMGDHFKSADGCNTCTCESTGAYSCTEMGCIAVGGATGAGGASGGTCVYDGVTYAAGAWFTAGCNGCTCSPDGSFQCTTMACAAGGAAAAGGANSTDCDCTGLAAGPEMICPDGSSPGLSCNRFTDGSCGWLSSGCPTAGAGGSGGVAGGSSVAGSSSTCPRINLQNVTCSNFQIVYDPNTRCASGYVCPQQDAGVCACSGSAPPVANQVCLDGSIGGPICTALSDGTCGWAMRGCPVPQDAGAGGATSLDAGPSAAAGSSGITVCVENNVAHNQGDVFRSTDGCNTCQCTVYGTMCTTLGCAVSCPAIDLALPQCGSDFTPIAEYDPAGCLRGYKCGPVIN